MYSMIKRTEDREKQIDHIERTGDGLLVPTKRNYGYRKTYGKERGSESEQAFCLFLQMKKITIMTSSSYPFGFTIYDRFSFFYDFLPLYSDLSSHYTKPSRAYYSYD